MQIDLRDSNIKTTLANNLVDLSYVPGALKNARNRAEIENCAVSTKFVSEEMRQLDKEVRMLEYEQPILIEAYERIRQAQKLAIEEAEEEATRMINETPKRLYPDLTSDKRLSDNFTPKKLFHAGKGDKGPDGMCVYTHISFTQN